MINQGPNGAGRVFTEQIIQWKRLEYILTHHPPSEPFILWLLIEPLEMWELGVSWGLCQMCVHSRDGKTCWKPAVNNFVPDIMLRALDTCPTHNSKKLLPHCLEVQLFLFY